MKNNVITYFVTGLMLMLLAPGCEQKQPTSTSTTGIAKMACDESFKNILEQEIEVFEYQYPEANIMPYYMDEASALDSLLHSDFDLIIISKDLTQTQRDYLKSRSRAYRSRKIAVDAVAVIVNNGNDIDLMSMDDLREIFTGKAMRWGDLYPTVNRNDSIKVVFDGNGSGVVHYIKDKFLPAGAKFGPNVYAQASSQDVFKAVEHNRNAIGFIGVSWITADMKGVEKTIDEKFNDLQNNNEVVAKDFTDKIRVLPLRGDGQAQGVKPYQVYINTGDYPLVRVIWAIDAAPSGTLEHGFYSFLTGVIGQKIILQTGILPAGEPVRVVETY